MANVMGIVSVLFITGNNVLIWLTIVVFNCVGVVAYTGTRRRSSLDGAGVT